MFFYYFSGNMISANKIIHSNNIKHANTLINCSEIIINLQTSTTTNFVMMSLHTHIHWNTLIEIYTHSNPLYKYEIIHTYTNTCNKSCLFYSLSHLLIKRIIIMRVCVIFNIKYNKNKQNWELNFQRLHKNNYKQWEQLLS